MISIHMDLPTDAGTRRKRLVHQAWHESWHAADVVVGVVGVVDVDVDVVDVTSLVR